MNFHQLFVFYEVARAGGFSPAAEKLFLTQPAVTSQVKNLESFYGLQVFERAGRKVVLTEEGRILYEYADRIFNLGREAEEALNDFRGLSRGTLRIGATFTFGDYYLGSLLGAFHRKYPRIVLQVLAGNTNQIIENVLAGQSDVAFVALDPRQEKITAREVISDALVGAVSREHPLARKKTLSIRDLHGQRLILREKGSSPRRLIEALFQERGIAPLVIMESASTAAIKKMAEEGCGIAVLSQQVIQKEVRAKTLVRLPFCDARILYHFYLIHHRDKYFSRALRAFRDLVEEIARETPAARG